MDDYGFIYVTHNQINGKKYIGKKNYDAAGSWKRYLGSGTYLSRAIEKYGKENFYREIIDTAKTPDELSRKEKYWISYYNAVESDDYYNIASGGDGGNVRAGYSDEEYARSEEKRIMAVRAGRKCGEECGSSKLTDNQVRQIIDDFIAGCYITQVAERYGLSVETVRDIREHKTWKHMTDGIVFPDVTGRMRGVGKLAVKPVDVFDKDMNYISTYRSAREAAEDLRVGFRLISQVCNGEKKSSHGYIFRFHNNLCSA